MCNLYFDFIVCFRPEKGLWVLVYRILLILLVGFIINNLHERAFAMMYFGQRRKMSNVRPEVQKRICNQYIHMFQLYRSYISTFIKQLGYCALEDHKEIQN